MGQITYSLQVDSVTPGNGSIAGGTVLTIEGAGFSSNTEDVHVTVGGVTCDLQSASFEKLECVTRSTSATHYVDNSGTHPGRKLALGYEALILNG